MSCVQDASADRRCAAKTKQKNEGTHPHDATIKEQSQDWLVTLCSRLLRAGKGSYQDLSIKAPVSPASRSSLSLKVEQHTSVAQLTVTRDMTPSPACECKHRSTAQRGPRSSLHALEFNEA